ncbi:hypothetical protein NEOLEDRAFT_1133898 [Neolentinus lepideus HHB14362 ss-1]|uniref:Uncharacterized protein n=1 Tax=Neolentinus lepideus HHB14362 ss-1 TaxID=1314782 RepID=A0A165SH00_9AGAM|nr:hypothetical protein NEOLEDRAFT_1133898 [Neolentinus lepideus HHB14362 ss-1]
MLPYLTEMERRREPLTEVQRTILGRHQGAWGYGGAPPELLLQPLDAELLWWLA